MLRRHDKEMIPFLSSIEDSLPGFLGFSGSLGLLGSLSFRRTAMLFSAIDVPCPSRYECNLTVRPVHHPHPSFFSQVSGEPPIRKIAAPGAYEILSPRPPEPNAPSNGGFPQLF